MKVFLTILANLFLFSSTLLNGQDLIDRTRQDLPYRGAGAEMNRIYRLVQDKRVNSRSQSIDLFELSTSIPVTDDEAIEREDAIFLTLDLDGLRTLRTQKSTFITLRVPVDKERFIELELFQSNIVTENFGAVTSAGDIILSSGLFYHGVVKGEPNSLVAISLFENEVRGLILDNDGNYNLGKLKDMDTYGLYNDKKLKTPPFFNCDTDDDEGEFRQAPSSSGKSRNAAAPIVKVYIECDYKMYQDHGNNATTLNNWVTGLFNEMAIIYKNEGITTQLSEVMIWSSTDPYAAHTSTGALLNAFETTRTTFNGDLAHLFSTKAQIGGLANIFPPKNTALCTSSPYAVSVLTELTYQSYPAYSNWVNVATHEMGHNLGAPHTHACKWGPNDNLAIDNCVATEGGCGLVTSPTPDSELATIMSYCHVGTVGTIYLNKGFGVEVGNHIRGQISQANCLSNCTVAPTASFINPKVTCVGEDLTFLSLSTCVENFNWSFTPESGGNPITSTAIKPTVTFNTAGTYIASLSASNNIGTDVTCQYVYVQNAPSVDCTPSGTPGNGGITYFSVSNLSNGSGNAATAGVYENFICKVASLEPNTTYQVTVTLGICSSLFEGLKVYIDYNNDGDFDDSGENVAASNYNWCGTVSAANDAGLQFTTPTSVMYNALLRMRVIANNPSPTGGCFVPTSGQVEDYGVWFDNGSTPSSCGSGGGGDLGNGACRSSMTISDSDIPGSTGIFRAQTTITTNGTVNIASGDGAVQFLAGQSITLNSGFHAQAGSNFTAKIEACTPAFTEEETEAIALKTTESGETILGHSDYQLNIEAAQASQLNIADLEIIPNPLTNETSFLFQLEKASPVNITVYDLNGHLIERVTREQWMTQGLNKVQYNASKLHAGMFYVVLQANAQIESKKMVVVDK